ncbi:MAG: BMC domain-containing protein [Desulfobacter sp.]
MSDNESMGFVETIGLAAAIQAADIMVKSANVKVETVANADAGLITVICRGDLASCNAAVDAAKAGIGEMGTFFNANRIPRPSTDVGVLVDDHIGNMLTPPAKPAKAAARKKK